MGGPVVRAGFVARVMDKCDKRFVVYLTGEYVAALEKLSTKKVDKTAAATTGGAIGISAFASFIGLCCIGPWAVALFGVSGAITMARWAPARPYILTVAAIMLAWAFWRVYRPRPVCEDGTCPAGPSVWLKLTLWMAVVLVGLAFFADELQWLLVDPTPEGLRK